MAVFVVAFVAVFARVVLGAAAAGRLLAARQSSAGGESPREIPHKYPQGIRRPRGVVLLGS